MTMATTDSGKDILRRDQKPLLSALAEAGADVSRPKSMCCPFHEDTNPSAGIYEKDGIWRFKCQACGAGGDVYDVQAKLAGKDPADVLRERRDRPAPKKRGPGPVVTIYHYANADGTLAYHVDRTSNKEFWPWHEGKHGKRVNGYPPTGRILYRQQDWHDAGAESFIFVCEGEKDADGLAAEGLAATTTPGGAGNGCKCDLAPLDGRQVVLLPDNDDKGRAHVQDMARRLQGKAASVRILELPGLADKGDVSDWLDAGGDGEELVRLAETAPELGNSPVEGDEVGNSQPEGEPEHRLIIRRASDVVCRAIDWLWQFVFVAGGINFVVGMPDVGKSVLTAYLAAKVSNGGEWPPIQGQRAPCRAGSVAFLSMEDHVEATIVPRLKEAGANLEKVAIVEGVKRVTEDGDGDIAIRDAFDISQDVPKLERLRQEMPDLSLVVIDPLDSYLNAKVDTNIGNKVRAALWPLKDWAESTGVTIIIVHHFNKSVSTNAMDRVSGARSFGALPRSVWAVGREDNDDRTIMAPMKLNVVSQENKRSLAYRIKSSLSNPSVPVIHWCDGDVDITASELLGGKRGKTDKAGAWLKEMLSEGPIESARLQELAEGAGQAWSTLKKAKDDAGVVAEQIREGGKVVGWQWRLGDEQG